MYYNMTNMTQATNILVMVQETNSLTGYLLGILVIMALFVVMFIAMKNFPPRTTLPIIFFLLSILGGLMTLIGLLPDIVTYILILAAAGTTLAGIFINPEG